MYCKKRWTRGARGRNSPRHQHVADPVPAHHPPCLVVVGGCCGGELKHIQLYMHETFSGPNATEGGIVESPFNSTFGQVAVFDNELRAGRDRSSALVARYQGLVVGTGQRSPGYLTSATVVFTAGEFNGSTLSLEGPFFSFTDTAERSIVSGTGKLRLARGYYLLKLVGKTSPETAVSQFDLFILMYSGGSAY